MTPIQALMEAQRTLAASTDPKHLPHVLHLIGSAVDGLNAEPVPQDFTTHRDAWRVALEEARDRSLTEAVSSYWAHELVAYDRAFSQLLAAQGSIDADGLPQLPEPLECISIAEGTIVVEADEVYSADQLRAAIIADRAARQSAAPAQGDGEDLPNRREFVAYWRKKYQYGPTHAFLDEHGNFCTPSDDPVHMGWSAWKAARLAAPAPSEPVPQGVAFAQNLALVIARLEQIMENGDAFEAGQLAHEALVCARALATTATSSGEAVATVVSRAGDDLRIGWLRPEQCAVGSMLYLAPPPPPATDEVDRDAVIEEAAKVSDEVMGRFEPGASIRALKSDKVCPRVRAGWSCTREAGHDGPCAALAPSEPVPAAESDVELLIDLSGRLAGIEHWVAQAGSRELALLAQRMLAPPADDKVCPRVRAGWSCTREAGHDGPCAAHPATELHYNAQRLRNVCALVGVPFDGDDAQVDECRGALLGLVAGRLRKMKAGS